MVGGQYLDVTEHAGHARGAAHPARAQDRPADRGLGACACSCYTGLTREPEAAYRRYAAELGVLFQIVDDILDVTGTDDALGKPQGSDERHGKRTYVTQYGLDGARRLARECHAAARSSLRDAAPNGAPELEQITDFILTRTA